MSAEVTFSRASAKENHEDTKGTKTDERFETFVSSVSSW
jgi:hypothetical protein